MVQTQKLLVEWGSRGMGGLQDPWKDILPRPMSDYFCSPKEFEQILRKKRLQDGWHPDRAFQEMEQQQRKRLNEE